MLILVQVWLRTEVLRTPSSTRSGFELMACSKQGDQSVLCKTEFKALKLALLYFHINLYIGCILDILKLRVIEIVQWSLVRSGGSTPVS